ncbi:hypothetical protein GEMRC1_005914 [Eukaryota sp. GEM-RC1]
MNKFQLKKWMLWITNSESATTPLIFTISMDTSAASPHRDVINSPIQSPVVPSASSHSRYDELESISETDFTLADPSHFFLKEKVVPLDLQVLHQDGRL